MKISPAGTSYKGQYNYAKKNLINQEKQRNNLEKMVNFLIKKFPAYVRAFKTKGKFNRKKKFPISKALKEFKFIEFNLETANFLIVDIDHRDISVAEIFEILRERNILPTYIVFTDRGYQVGWELEHPFITNPKYQTPNDAKLEKYARYILRKLAYILKGDPAAIRIKGVWRNPITNKSRFYFSKKYLLNELDIYVKEIDDKIKTTEDGVRFHTNGSEIKNKVARILIDRDSIKDVVPGERNSVLWYIGMFIAKEINRNNQLKLKEKYKALEKVVKKELLMLNSMLSSPLSKKEVLTIFKSVKRYFSENRIIVSFGKYENWSSEIKNKYIKAYRKRKGITKFSREEIKKNNLIKVASAASSSKSIKEAIEKSGLSKSAFYKYYKILNKKKQLFFFIKLLVCLQKKNLVSNNSLNRFLIIVLEHVYETFKYIFDMFKNEIPFLNIKKLDERRLIYSKFSFLSF